MKITMTDELAAEIRMLYQKGGITYAALGAHFGFSENAIRHAVRERKTMRQRYEERFWKRVIKRGAEDCWEWTGAKSTAGYGQLRMYGQAFYAHRLIWEWTYGSIPDGIEVCHACDNPECVNPAHLFLGSHADNIVDMHTKGRWRSKRGIRGEANGNSKLTWPDVREIRQRYVAGGETQRGLAIEYGVGKTTIARVLRNQTWWAH